MNEASKKNLVPFTKETAREAGSRGGKASVKSRRRKKKMKQTMDMILSLPAKEKYKDFMYIEGMPEDKNNVPFYEKHGFSRKFSPFIVIPISSFPTCSIESL